MDYYSQQPKKEPEPELELELDELDEEEESEDDSNPNAFKIRGALPEYQEHKMSIRQLHDLIHDGGIDLEPSYQRDVVWTESKQSNLIHSLFHNFYVPPIVFAVHPAEDDPNEEVRVCVDGKQRLTSIQKFCDGQIPFKQSKSQKQQWWFIAPQSSRTAKAEIPEAYKEQFLKRVLTCVEYRNLPPGAEHEVFQRVQMGMTLTGPEKLQALSTPWAQWIRELERKHVGIEGGLASVLEWDTRRGRDFSNIAYFVCCCDFLPGKEEIPTSQSAMKWLEREDPPSEHFKSEIEGVLIDFWNIANDRKLNHGLKNIGNRLAPAEFIYIGVLLFVMRKKTMEERAHAITTLRKHVRANHKDIRLNTTVGRSMWAIIGSAQTKSSHHGQSGSNGKKRRKDDDDDDEDEYRPAPVNGLSKTAHTRSKKKTVLT